MIVKRVEREKIVISGDEQSAIDVFRGGEPLNYARVSDGLAILDGSVWSGPSIVIRQSGTDRLIAVASDALGFVNEPNEYGGRGHLLDNPLFFGAIANGPERPKVPQSYAHEEGR